MSYSISRFGSKRKASKFLKAADALGILTVGAGQGFLEAGGMIEMGFQGKKIQFDASVPASTRANLRISSQVLKLAKKVVN